MSIPQNIVSMIEKSKTLVHLWTKGRRGGAHRFNPNTRLEKFNSHLHIISFPLGEMVEFFRTHVEYFFKVLFTKVLLQM